MKQEVIRPCIKALCFQKKPKTSLPQAFFRTTGKPFYVTVSSRFYMPLIYKSCKNENCWCSGYLFSHCWLSTTPPPRVPTQHTDSEVITMEITGSYRSCFFELLLAPRTFSIWGVGKCLKVEHRVHDHQSVPELRRGLEHYFAFHTSGFIKPWIIKHQLKSIFHKNKL